MRRSANILLFLMVALTAQRLDSSATVVAGPSAARTEQTVTIIVNQSNSVDNFAFEELRKVFLGERSHWPNGRRITLVMLEPSQPERQAVLRDIYEMSERDLNNHFIRGIFTGAVFVSPKTFANSAEVRKFVFNVPGAIGYIRSSDADSTVKILRIDGRLPDDKDYRFRPGTSSSK